jgi:hypothetical protein
VRPGLVAQIELERVAQRSKSFVVASQFGEQADNR